MVELDVLESDDKMSFIFFSVLGMSGWGIKLGDNFFIKVFDKSWVVSRFGIGLVCCIKIFGVYGI